MDEGELMNVIKQQSGNQWTLYNGDCVEVVRGIPTASVGMTHFSPPYLALYVYSNSARDMGNCKTEGEFYTHFSFLITELMRVMKPGRIVAVDCMNVPAMKERDGYIGLKDFRGELIYLFKKAGFIFHSEHCIWKDPLIEATRTKALGLMHKQLMKDSAMCRAGIPQYLLAFRKPGENPDRVAHNSGLEWFGEKQPTEGNMSHERWRRYASPVWTDIDFGNTLNATAARDKDDERHVCPMALDITARAVELWTNPNDIVFSPFTGIGSEGYQSILQGRRFIGAELKPAYFEQACKNLAKAEQAAKTQQQDFFAEPKPTIAKSKPKPKPAKKSPAKTSKRKSACAGAK